MTEIRVTRDGDDWVATDGQVTMRAESAAEAVFDLEQVHEPPAEAASEASRSLLDDAYAKCFSRFGRAVYLAMHGAPKSLISGECDLIKHSLLEFSERLETMMEE